MLMHGYCLVVRNYKAEITEFDTLSVLTMPDGTKQYLVQTKFGEDYFNERDLRETEESFVSECEQLNKALAGTREGGKFGFATSGYPKRK